MLTPASQATPNTTAAADSTHLRQLARGEHQLPLPSEQDLKDTITNGVIGSSVANVGLFIAVPAVSYLHAVVTATSKNAAAIAADFRWTSAAVGLPLLTASVAGGIAGRYAATHSMNETGVGAVVGAVVAGIGMGTTFKNARMALLGGALGAVVGSVSGYWAAPPGH